MRLKNMISNLSDNRWLPIDDDALSGLEMYGEIAESLEELVDQWNKMDKLTEEKVAEILDILKENGELGEIINHIAIPELYHRRIKFYKTYDDMISDKRIIEGQLVVTLGRDSINDGEGTAYIKTSEGFKQYKECRENFKIFKERETTGYALDIANLSGQTQNAGKGANDPAQKQCRAVVLHNYVDSEPMVIDNVGDASSIFIRNARNVQRRIDKPDNYIGGGEFLKFQQGYMNPDGVNHSFSTIFNMDRDGNMYWRDNRPGSGSIKFMTVSQEKTKAFQFVFAPYYDSRYLLDIQSSNNKSAFKFSKDTSGNSQIMAPANGLRLTANKGNAQIEALNGSIILDSKELLYRKDGKTTLPLGRFVTEKPANSTAPGQKGDYYADSLHLYVCYNPNMWIRISKDSW